MNSPKPWERQDGESEKDFNIRYYSGMGERAGRETEEFAKEKVRQIQATLDDNPKENE